MDAVFVLNTVLDYLLLVVCGSVTTTPLRRGRALLSGGIGGGYAVLSLVPGFSFLGNFFWQLVFTVVLCLIAFGAGRQLIRQSVVLLLLAAAFSGIVLLLTEMFSAPKAFVGARVYYPVSLGVLLLTGGGACGLLKWSLGRLGHHGGDIAVVEIQQGGRSVSLHALRDTGNTLRDPVSGAQVLVTDWTVLRRLLPEVPVEAAMFSDPASLVQQLGKLAPEVHTRLIPYKAVGVAHGLLVAMRPEKIKVAGKEENLLLAFSPVLVSDGGGYEALLGGAI